MPQPILSICVPSRNRQIYFQEAIKSLTACTRDDVEFVFADNSDDPAIMDGFMQGFAGDPRIRYLPSPPETLAMMDNWERALEVATGRFVSFIGDDDFIDPELAGFLANLEQQIDADAICWTGPNYIWPTEGSRPHIISINLNTGVTLLDRKRLMRRAFLWEDCSHVPLSGCSIYHGALSRRLLDRIRRMGNGRYFEFPVVDYEMAFKAILFGETFVHVARPFSVLGACPLSNSRAIGNVEAERKSQEVFNGELGRDLNQDAWKADMPFETWHGISACIYVIQYWLTRRYGITHEGFEQKLVGAFAANCGLFRTEAEFELVAERYRQAIAAWHGGRYLEYFNPVFTPRPAPSDAPRFTGVKPNGTLVFFDDIAGIRTPGELFQLCSSLLIRPGDIEIDLRRSADQDRQAEPDSKAA